MKKLLYITTLFFVINVFTTKIFAEQVFDAVGYENFYNALSFKKFYTQDTTLQLLTGMYYQAKRTNDDNEELDLRLGLRVRGKFISFEKVKVEKFFEVGTIIDDTHQRDRSRTNFYVSVGLIPEIFVYKNFSFEIPLGIGLVLEGESAPNANDNSTIITTFGQGLNLGVSFHIYF
jgi:hypothetical protein